jgi:hypothetical protein
MMCQFALDHFVHDAQSDVIGPAPGSPWAETRAWALDNMVYVS